MEDERFLDLHCRQHFLMLRVATALLGVKLDFTPII